MSTPHEHHHDHAHGPSPEEAAADPVLRRRLWIALALAGTVVLAQAVGAALTGSLALLTDTAHAVTDASGLAVALVAAILMARPATPRRTWGLRRLEVVAALGQAALLLLVGAYSAVEAVRRLVEPPAVDGTGMLLFGVLGLAANLAAAAVLASSRGANLSMRAAFLEVVNDALGSLGVIAAAAVVAVTGWTRADAVAGLLIVVLIVPRAVSLLRQTLRVLLEFTPEGLDLDEVRTHLLEVEHVLEVHDLHASTVATGLPVLTAHVVVEDGCFTDGHAAQILEQLRECTREHFPLAVPHSTFQLETAAIAADDAHHTAHP